MTLRRLEDEVALWRHLKETRPAVWERLEGGPLPEGLLIVPGRPLGLHAFSHPEAGSPAAAFLRALEADEEAAPLPGRTCRIRLRVEPEVRSMWEATLRRCRATVRPELSEWEVLAIVLREFWLAWDNVETRRQRRQNPTPERDGWRCTAPACRSLGTGRLHEHHIVPRSAGDDEDQANTTTLCGGHHLGLLHEGKIRCRGRAPDRLHWELGVEAGRAAFLVFEAETRVAGEAA